MLVSVNNNGSCIDSPHTVIHKLFAHKQQHEIDLVLQSCIYIPIVTTNGLLKVFAPQRCSLYWSTVK